MLASQITSALATRRTVRVTYHRAIDAFSVVLVQGDEVLEMLTYVLVSDRYDPEAAEALAEREAASAARCRGLDVSRLDVN